MLCVRERRSRPVEFTEEAEELLVSCYRKLRENDSVGSRSQTAYRITVRQLESLIRLSEALAKLFFDQYVLPKYVIEANRLLQKSIIHVESGDVNLDDVDEWAVEEPMDEEKEPEPEKVVQDAMAKNVIHVTFEEYKQMTSAIVLLLCRARDDAARDKPDEVLKGLPLARVMNELLVAMHIEDPEELLYKKKIVRMVIHRLIKKDHVLVVNCDIAYMEEDNWIIDVHPNFVLP